MDVTVLGPFGYLYFSGTLGIAAVMAAAHWRELGDNLLSAGTTPPAPMDCEPHILTMLGADGRPNPARYEVHDDYPGALSRQRELASRGQPCVVRHAETGAVRFDLSALDPYRRISF